MKFIVILSLFLFSSLQARDLREIEKEATSIGKKQKNLALELIKTSPFQIEDLPFVPKDILKEKPEKNELYIFLEDIKEISLELDDSLFQKSEQVFENSEKYTNEYEKEEMEYVYEICLEEDQPFKVIINRNLNVNVNTSPINAKIIRTCLGHKNKDKFFWESEAIRKVKKLKKKLGNDPSIRHFDVEISDNGVFGKYVVTTSWVHKENKSECDYFSEKCEYIEEKSEEDNWTESLSDYQSLLNTPQCTLVSKTCLDDRDKSISGKLIHRQCWNEELTYFCKHPTRSHCNTLRKNKCIFSNKICLQNGEFGCSLWELTFKCPKDVKIYSKKLDGEIFGKEISEENEEIEGSTNFSDMAITLDVFQEMHSELTNSKASDVRTIQLFKGNLLQCSRNISESLMYDCCFSFKGLANKLLLSKCNSDELALSEMRDKGLCHYVGSYEEKFLGLWKSSTKRSFCCFNSKLSRVFQEKSREQLGIGWGDPKHPDCSGFKNSDIEKIDFSRLDLSEAYEEPKSVDLEAKFKSLEENLRKKLQSELKND